MSGTPSRAAILLAFAAIYIIWGSTYLAIRYGVQTIPPFSMGGVRFLIAGAVLYAYAQWREPARPTLVQWGATAIVGGLLFLGGNGLLSWSEQFIESGVAALLVATTPVWMVLLAWTQRGGSAPGLRVVAGLVLGFGGLAVLVGPAELAGSGRLPLWPVFALLMGSVCWSIGSVYSRSLPLPRSSVLTASMQMITGGALLMVTGLVLGEHRGFHLSQVAWQSAAAFFYLMVIGSWVGFTAYVFLLKWAAPAHVATYAYVNPIVAVFLGWAIAGEEIGARMLLAAAIIIAGVVLIVSGGSKPKAQPAPARRAAGERAPAAALSTTSREQA
jgi:drug/metabolite transporter (DMT)-like permease